ncbi:MAG: hypothetical protein WC718_07075 [Phycisphaerales bacterium]
MSMSKLVVVIFAATVFALVACEKRDSGQSTTGNGRPIPAASSSASASQHSAQEKTTTALSKQQSGTAAEQTQVERKVQSQRQDFVVKGFFLGMNSLEAHAAIKATGSDYRDLFIANLALRHNVWKGIEIQRRDSSDGLHSLDTVPASVTEHSALLRTLKSEGAKDVSDGWDWDEAVHGWSAVTGKPEPTEPQRKIVFLARDKNEAYHVSGEYPGDSIITLSADAVTHLPINDPKYEPIFVGLLSTANQSGDIECRFDGKGNVANKITFSGEATGRLFRSGDLSAREFVQAFVNAYHIPEMKYNPGRNWLNPEWWEYRDPRGLLIRIAGDKSINIQWVTATAELNFGG